VQPPKSGVPGYLTNQLFRTCVENVTKSVMHSVTNVTMYSTPLSDIGKRNYFSALSLITDSEKTAILVPLCLRITIRKRARIRGVLICFLPD